MGGGADSEFDDEEIYGYMNDVVIIMSGFLPVIFVSFMTVELLVGPLVAGVSPAFAGSILNCVWTGSESVCTGGVTPRALLVIAHGLPLTVLWLNTYQHRIRPRLAARDIVP